MDAINQVKIPFGIDSTGVLRHISEVESGLKCNCYCPSCKGSLIARKGSVQQHCFQHYSADCGKATETAIHMFIKNVIKDCTVIKIPPHKFSQSEFSLEIETVEVEKGYKDIVPDVTISSGNSMLFLEIYVTHSIDSEKLKKIKRYGISTLELDVNELGVDFYNFDKKQIINSIINNIDCKKWIYNKKEEDELNKLNAIAQERKIRTDIKIEQRRNRTSIELKNIKDLMPQINAIKKKLNCEIFFPYICDCGGKVITIYSSTYKYFFAKCTSCKQDYELGIVKRTGISYFKNYYFTCDKCGSKYKLNHNSKTDKIFLGCSKYPECKNTKKVAYINNISELNSNNLENIVKTSINKLCGI